MIEKIPDTPERLGEEVKTTRSRTMEAGTFLR